MARCYRFFLKNPQTYQLLEAKKDFSLFENLEPEVFFQLVKVLRVKENDQIVFLADKTSEQDAYIEYSYKVIQANKKEIVLEFVGIKQNINELPYELELVLCLPSKPEKLEFILQKAVELGVSRIILVEGEFSQIKHRLRADRLEKIMVEAAEQSERAYIPKLEIQGKLRDFLNECPVGELLVAMERMQENKYNEVSLMDVGQSNLQKKTILIGPEGGFSPSEKDLIVTKRFSCFSLGKRILRMETAAILSLGLFAVQN